MSNKWIHLTNRDLVGWRMEHGFTRRQLALYFRTTTGLIRAWERDEQVPPEWIQDRMASLVLAEEPPKIAVPRRRRRRYRWSKLTGDTLFLWRKGWGLKQMDAAAILGVSQATLSRWERNESTPIREVQVAIRERIDRYDDDYFPKPTSSETGPDSDKQITEQITEQKETESMNTTESVMKKAQTLWDKIDSLKLGERTSECRWGKYDGFVVVRSNVSGAHYLWDIESGNFYRTKHPRSNQIQSDRPQGVIHEDRQWLYPLLKTEGQSVLKRYHEGQTTSTPAAPTSPTSPQITPVAAVLTHSLIDLKPTVETEEILIVRKKGKLTVRLDHMLSMLKAAGYDVPAGATADVDVVNFTWDLGEERTA